MRIRKAQHYVRLVEKSKRKNVLEALDRDIHNDKLMMVSRHKTLIKPVEKRASFEVIEVLTEAQTLLRTKGNFVFAGEVK